MGNRRKSGIVLAVTLTIAVAFVVIGMLFLRESVQNAVNYAESEDELYAMGLSSELESYMSRQYALVGSTVLDQNLQDAVGMEEARESEQKIAAVVAPMLSHLTNNTSSDAFVAFATTRHVYLEDGSCVTVGTDDRGLMAWVSTICALLEQNPEAAFSGGPFFATFNNREESLVLAARPLVGAEGLQGVVGVGVPARDLGHVLDITGSGERKAVYFNEDGVIAFGTSGARAESPNVFMAYPDIAGLQSQLDQSLQSPLKLWVGLHGLLPREQTLYTIRYDDEFGLYMLTVDSAHAIFDEMRARSSTLLLALTVVMLLLLFMVVGIVRWFRSRLIQAITTDELTGLSNRKSFVESYESLAESSRLDQATILLIDVDKFKQINDTYGHATGDLALSAIAGEIRLAVGDDGLTGRWGGDEFIAVLCTGAEEALRRARTLIDRVAQLKLADGVRVSISVGAAAIDVRQPLERMVENADDALYSTKRGGRGFLTQYQEGVTPHAGDKLAVQDADVNASVACVEPDDAHAPAGQAQKDNYSWHDLFETFVLSLLEAVHRMVPFVAGGGILIAIAFLIDGASVDIASLSDEARASFGSITPIAANLSEVGAAAFNFMLPIFAAFFAQALGGSEAFMAGFAGGYLSSQSGAGFVGAVCAAVVSAFVARLMHGFVKETNLTIRRMAPVLIYPVFSLLIMSLLMTFFITPVAVAFESLLTSMLISLEDKGHTVLGAVCGAMMATDMGGPINKAAYHFGVAAIANGSPDIMASVMVGGMVPPCGIALSMLLFKNRFSDAEHDQGVSTLFMGLAFITEGAIPFVLTDPVRVILSCMAGSALAGSLSSVFGCTLMAPHGGVFVFPVVDNAPLYCVALLAGSILCALVLGFIKPVCERT